MSDNTNKVVVQFIGDATNLERSMKKVESALNGMNNSIGKSMLKAMVGFELLKQGLKMVANVTVDGTNDAIRYEAIMDNLGQRLGKSAEQFVKWSDTTGKAMGFSKLQSAEMANTLTVTLSQIATSQEDLTNRTTKLMEASAIIRAKTGRSMQDVSERIRSAMNQEADGADELGLNVRTNAIQMSNAYKQMADGTPWKELTTNQQKAILYQYILDQTAQNYGTTLSENTSLKMAQFTASLADMRLALGQAFLPIVNVALPYLSALVQWITTALGYVRVFMETLFGYKHDGGAGIAGQANAMKSYGGAVNDATKAQDKLNESKAKGSKADGAKKDNKKVEGLANFDEIHTLPKQGGSSSGGAGGSGGGGGDFGAGGLQLATDNTGGLIGKLSEAQQKVSEFAERFKTFISPIVSVCMQVWDAVSNFVVGVFKGLNEWWDANGDYIGKGFMNLWNNFLYPVFKFIVEMIWGNVKGAIHGLVTFFEGLLQFIGGIFSGEWSKAFEGVWMMVKGAFEFIWNYINILFMIQAVGAIKGGLKAIGEWFASFFSLKGDKSILALVEKGLASIVEFFGKGMKSSWEAIVNAFKGLGTWAKSSIWTPLKTTIDDVAGFFTKGAKSMWDGFTGALKGLWGWVKSNIVDPIGNAFKSIWTGFSTDGILGGIKAIFNSGIRYLNTFINLFNSVKNKIPFIDSGSDIPRIPQLYNGGITNGKTIAQIGDNVGGQEVVAPLDRLNSIIAKTMADTLSWQGGQGGGGSTEVVLKVGSTEFGRVCVDSINKLTKQEGRLGLNI